MPDELACRTGGEPVQVLAVVGATATGKSDVAVALAQELGGEVVNADAFQLYRGMDVGTAKLTRAERQGVPHHQLDVLDIHQDASVAAYQRAARADVEDILARGRVPVVVGGSGLYVRALLDRLEIPPTDPEVRARWEDEVEQRGLPAIVAELARRDPRAAAAIEPGNARRVVRALEVIDLTGRPFSATLPTRELWRPTRLIGLRCPRPVLDERIERRVERMWAGGMLGEVAGLAARGLAATRTAGRAVGYAQAMAQLSGDLTAEAAMAATAQATRRLARRQESWFGADPRVEWLDVPPGADPVAVARSTVCHAHARGLVDVPLR